MAAIGIKEAQKGAVGVRHAAISIEGKNPGRNTFQNRLNVLTALLKGGVGVRQFMRGCINLISPPMRFRSGWMPSNPQVGRQHVPQLLKR